MKSINFLTLQVNVDSLKQAVKWWTRWKGEEGLKLWWILPFRLVMVLRMRMLL